MSDTEQKEKTPEQQDVLTKYQTAGAIANKALAAVVAACEAGKKIVDVCNQGDELLKQEVDKVYNKAVAGKKVEKGIAFPTSLSVNNTAGHYSPEAGDETVLKTGDLVKIDLGAHVDGFAAMVGHTIVVGEKSVPKGKASDVVAAAQTAADAVLRMLRPGAKSSEITEMIVKAAETFNVTPAEGVLSHNMRQFVPDGSRVIPCKGNPEAKVEEIEIEPYEVYAVDVVMTTGTGKVKEQDAKTTIYRRRMENSYNLKLTSARQMLSEVEQRFSAFPFTTRALSSSRALLGVSECVTHELLQPYPVLFEKAGELVAQVKFTAIVTPTVTIKLTGVDGVPTESEHKVTDEALKEVLARSLKKKRAKKAAAKPAAAAAAADAPKA